MATFFRNKVIKSVGTVPVEIVSVASGSKVTAIGLSVANLLDGNTRVSIQVKDDTSVLGFYVKDGYMRFGFEPATLATFLISFSWPVVGGLNRPNANTIVSFASVKSLNLRIF